MSAVPALLDRAAAEVVDEVSAAEVASMDTLTHLTCHCSQGRVSACGLDVAHLENLGAVEDQGDDCNDCLLAWPDGSTCPFACACPECWT